MLSVLDDAQILQFDSWETLDEENMEFTNSSVNWTQFPYEEDRVDTGPTSDLNSIHPVDINWRIIDTPEEQHKDNILYNDCMWASSCIDIKHPSNTFVPSDLITATPGQSLLRYDISPPRLDTPPSLDGDEPPQFHHAEDIVGTALRLLKDSVAVATDHSYSLAPQHNMDYLGAQTPFDSCESEEGIDVVSIGTIHQQLATTSQNIVENVITRPPARTQLLPSPIPAASVPRWRSGPGKRGPSNTDTDFQTERRSMLNERERLRRIGLKNLLDELKKQIPATREKERVAKVVILREAAALCRKLQEEELEKEYLKEQQNKLQAKLKKLHAKLARSHIY